MGRTQVEDYSDRTQVGVCLEQMPVVASSEQTQVGAAFSEGTAEALDRQGVASLLKAVVVYLAQDLRVAVYLVQVLAGSLFVVQTCGAS